jgi:hypothetical protein
MDSHQKMGEFEHVPVSYSMRAPRVAIVVPTYEPWQFYATAALNEAKSIWGGAGFILIPHDEGKITLPFLRLINAYDPDYIVGIEFSRVELMRISLERHGVKKSASEFFSEEEVARDTGLSKCPLSFFDAVAIEAASKACTPFIDYYDDEGLELSPHTRLSELQSASTLDGTSDGAEVVRLSSRAPETGDLSVIRASKTGIMFGFSEESKSSEFDDEKLVEVARDLLGVSADLGDYKYLPWTTHTGWSLSLQDLLAVTRTAPRRNYFLIVGNSCQDYYLAYNLDRLGAVAIWIPETWLAPGSMFSAVVGEFIHVLKRSIRSVSLKVKVLSTRSDTSALIQQILALPLLHSSSQSDLGLIPESFEKLDFDLIRNTKLVLRDDYDSDDVLPARRSQSGTLEFINRIPAWLPNTPGVPKPREWYWILEVDVGLSNMVSGRAFPGHFLEHREAEEWESLRSSKDGISVKCFSSGRFLSVSATPRQKLARPRLKVPSLFDWVRLKAESQGWTCRLSDAGQKSASAARLWGSNESLADDLYKYAPFFMEFVGKKSGTLSIDAYPKFDGKLIGKDGYLSANAAIRTLLPTGITESEVRLHLDRFLELGVIRRGLVLKCLQCGKRQWLELRTFAMELSCQRCGAYISINVSTWENHTIEPVWFYDLHPIIRQLLETNGDIPILAGRKIQKELKLADFIQEVEFRKQDQLIEIDLIVGNRDKLVISECKKKPINSKRELNKKNSDLVQIADLLQADKLILACGVDLEWSDSDKLALEKQLDGPNKITARFREVELIKSLRTSAAITTVLGQEVGPDFQI